MFRGSLEHTGVYDATGAPTLHGVKWAFHTGGQIYSSPAVADGVAYVGSTDGGVYAVEITTGTQKWRLATKGRVVSSPAVAAGTVFVESYDSNLYAIDAATGKSKWTFATAGEHRFIARHIHGLEPENDAVPDPWISICRRRPSWAASCTSAAATATSTPSTPPPVRSSGSSRPECRPRLAGDRRRRRLHRGLGYLLPRARCGDGRELWEFKTGEDDGDSQPDRHPVLGRCPTASCTSGAATRTSMPSRPRPARRSGPYDNEGPG